MIPAARIQSSIELLEEIISREQPASPTISSYFRNRRFIGSKDRRSIKTRVYRIIRSWHRLGWWLESKEFDINPRNLVMADLSFEHKYSLEDIENLFSGQKFSSSKLNEKEIELAKYLIGEKLHHRDMPLRERCECPEWAFDYLQEDFSERLEEELQALMSEAPMDIRVNTIKANPADVLAELKEEGLDVYKGERAVNAIRIYNRPQLLNHQLYLQGKIEFQDEGSQLVAEYAEPKPGEQVMDFCAGAGGKTLALGAAMQNKGRIIAVDVSRTSLDNAKKRFVRAGLHNIEMRQIRDERDSWLAKRMGKFDLVLVDVPCTGSGTWRRDPEKHWRVLGPSLDELLVLQKNILESAARIVKPGGRLIYATCSILSVENEKQVESFIKSHTDFKIKGDFLKLTPAQTNTDGFFAARIERLSRLEGLL